MFNRLSVEGVGFTLVGPKLSLYNSTFEHRSHVHKNQAQYSPLDKSRHRPLFKSNLYQYIQCSFSKISTIVIERTKGETRWSRPFTLTRTSYFDLSIFIIADKIRTLSAIWSGLDKLQAPEPPQSAKHSHEKEMAIKAGFDTAQPTQVPYNITLQWVDSDNVIPEIQLDKGKKKRHFPTRKSSLIADNNSISSKTTSS